MKKTILFLIALAAILVSGAARPALADSWQDDARREKARWEEHLRHTDPDRYERIKLTEKRTELMGEFKPQSIFSALGEERDRMIEKQANAEIGLPPPLPRGVMSGNPDAMMQLKSDLEEYEINQRISELTRGIAVNDEEKRSQAADRDLPAEEESLPAEAPEPFRPIPPGGDPVQLASRLSGRSLTGRMMVAPLAWETAGKADPFVAFDDIQNVAFTFSGAQPKVDASEMEMQKENYKEDISPSGPHCDQT